VSLEWDAHTYDRISDPMARWGSAVVERLRLMGSESVLDAGCGTGRVTEMLLDRLPRGEVVALDASLEMLSEAKRRLAPYEGRVAFVLADLAQPLPLDRPVDAVLSTATFHWVHDHDALFANLAAVLRAGGQLEAQCGGAGNIASVQTVLAALGCRTDDVYFATPEETERRLTTAGFEDAHVWLHPELTPLPPGPELETYLATIVLRAHVAHMGESERAAFVSEVAARLPRHEVDYVRLNISATRAGPGSAVAARAPL
jgi:trans-aconitate 2-methyltransferase